MPERLSVGGGARDARVGLLRAFLLTDRTSFWSATIWDEEEWVSVHKARYELCKGGLAYDFFVVTETEVVLDYQVLVPGERCSVHTICG